MTTSQRAVLAAVVSCSLIASVVGAAPDESRLPNEYAPVLILEPAAEPLLREWFAAAGPEARADASQALAQFDWTSGAADSGPAATVAFPFGPVGTFDCWEWGPEHSGQMIVFGLDRLGAMGTVTCGSHSQECIPSLAYCVAGASGASGSDGQCDVEQAVAICWGSLPPTV